MELVTTMVLNFATKLDAHLARFAAPPSKQLKPETTVNTISCKAACGETFSVRLLDASNTHEVKRAEVKDRSVVVQVGKEPGKTTVTLIVVRGDNLAVGTTEVQVEITDRRWGEGWNSVDVEFGERLVDVDVGVKVPFVEFLKAAK